MNKKELAKQFPWLTKGEIEYEVNHVFKKQYKTEKGFFAHLAKENEKNMQVFSMPDVKRIYIDITWKKSPTWGYCPRAEYQCWFADGTYKEGKTGASGYGYDKHSAAVAEVFNACCKGMAWRKRNSRKVAPYGLMYVGKGSDKSWRPYFEGGIGISCYPQIVKYLGGKMESHSGKTWDSHIITF